MKRWWLWQRQDITDSNKPTEKKRVPFYNRMWEEDTGDESSFIILSHLFHSQPMIHLRNIKMDMMNSETVNLEVKFMRQILCRLHQHTSPTVSATFSGIVPLKCPLRCICMRTNIAADSCLFSPGSPHLQLSLLKWSKYKKKTKGNVSSQV